MSNSSSPDKKAYKEIRNYLNNSPIDKCLKPSEYELNKKMRDCQRVKLVLEIKIKNNIQYKDEKGIFAFLDTYFIFLYKDGYFKKKMEILLLDDLYQVVPKYTDNQSKYVESFELYFKVFNVNTNIMYIIKLESSGNFNANRFFYQFSKWTNFIYSNEGFAICPTNGNTKVLQYSNGLSRPDLAVAYHFSTNAALTLKKRYDDMYSDYMYSDDMYSDDMYSSNMYSINIAKEYRHQETEKYFSVVFEEDKKQGQYPTQRNLTLHPDTITYLDVNYYSPKNVQSLVYTFMNRTLPCIDLTRNVETIKFGQINPNRRVILDNEREYKRRLKNQNYKQWYKKRAISRNDFSEIVTDFLLRKTCVKKVIFESEFADFDLRTFNSNFLKGKKDKIGSMESLTFRFFTTDDVYQILYHACINKNIKEIGFSLDPNRVTKVMQECGRPINFDRYYYFDILEFINKDYLEDFKKKIYTREYLDKSLIVTEEELLNDFLKDRLGKNKDKEADYIYKYIDEFDVKLNEELVKRAIAKELRNKKDFIDENKFKSRLGIVNHPDQAYETIVKFLPAVVENQKGLKSLVCTDWMPETVMRPESLKAFMQFEKLSFLRRSVTKKIEIKEFCFRDPEKPQEKLTLKDVSDIICSGFTNEFYFSEIDATTKEVKDRNSDSEKMYPNIFILEDRRKLRNIPDGTELDKKSYPSVISIRDTVWDMWKIIGLIKAVCMAKGAAIFLDLSGTTIEKAEWQSVFIHLLKDPDIFPKGKPEVVESLIGIDLSQVASNIFVKSLPIEFFDFMMRCPKLERLHLRNVIKGEEQKNAINELIACIERIQEDYISLGSSHSMNSSAQFNFSPAGSRTKFSTITPNSMAPDSPQQGKRRKSQISGGPGSGGNIACKNSIGNFTRSGSIVRIENISTFSVEDEQNEESDIPDYGLKVIDITNNDLNEDDMVPLIDLLTMCRRLQKLVLKGHKNDSQPQIFLKLLHIKTLEELDVTSTVMTVGGIRMLADHVRSGLAADGKTAMSRGRLKIAWPFEMLVNLEKRGRTMKLIYDKQIQKRIEKQNKESNDVQNKESNDVQGNKSNDVQNKESNDVQGNKSNDVQGKNGDSLGQPGEPGVDLTDKEIKGVLSRLDYIDYIGVSPSDIGELYQSIYESANLPLSKEQIALHPEMKDPENYNPETNATMPMPARATDGAVSQEKLIKELDELIGRRKGITQKEETIKPEDMLDNAIRHLNGLELSNQYDLAKIDWDSITSNFKEMKKVITTRTVVKQSEKKFQLNNEGRAGYDPNYKGNGVSAVSNDLKTAILEGDKEKIEELLDKVYVNEELIKESVTTKAKVLVGGAMTLPLLFAAKNKGTREIMSIFEKKGADMFARDRQGNNVLIAAAAGNNIDLVKYFLQEKYDPNVANIDGDTPLHMAVLNENKEICAVLAEKGANRSQENRAKKTPTSIAKEQKKNTPIYQLFAARWKPYAKVEGEYPLKEDREYLCSPDGIESVQDTLRSIPYRDGDKLYNSKDEPIEKGAADPIQREEDGPFVEMLTKSIIGSGLEPINKEKKSVQVDNDEAINEPDMEHIVNIKAIRPLSGFCNLESRVYQEVPALCLACETGSVESIKILIDAHAEINARGRNGETPLMILARRKFDFDNFSKWHKEKFGKDEALKPISDEDFMELHNKLFTGANVWTQDISGRSLLHTPNIEKQAIHEGKTYYQILVDAGADVYVKDAEMNLCPVMKEKREPTSEEKMMQREKEKDQKEVMEIMEESAAPIPMSTMEADSSEIEEPKASDIPKARSEVQESEVKDTKSVRSIGDSSDDLDDLSQSSSKSYSIKKISAFNPRPIASFNEKPASRAIEEAASHPPMPPPEREIITENLIISDYPNFDSSED